MLSRFRLLPTTISRLAALAASIVCAICLCSPAHASASTLDSVTFLNVSGASFSSSTGIDSCTTGTQDKTIAPADNVLYLPSSASLTLEYRVNFSSSSASSNMRPMSQEEPEVSDSADASSAETSASTPPSSSDANDDGAADGAVSSNAGADDSADAAVVASDSSVEAQTTLQIDIYVSSSSPEGTFTLDPDETMTDSLGQIFWHLAFHSGDETLHVYVYKSAALESMYIDTVNGLDWIEQSKDNRDKGGAMSIVSEDAQVVYEGSLAEMKGRGNSTWTYAKKPYQIKLAKKAELVDGAGSAKTWILLANYLDESLIRNAVVNEIAEGAGYASTIKGKPVDLYIDGNYRGSYYLCEKVQIATNRIEIADLEDANDLANPGVDVGAIEPTRVDITAGTTLSRLQDFSYVDIESPDDVTGGYLLEFELEGRYRSEDSYFTTTRGVHFVIKSPEQASYAEVEYIANYVQDLEDAVYSSSGENSKGRRFTEYMDVDSVAFYYAIAEAMGQVDAFQSSTFLCKDAGESSKIFAGPVWDNDRCLGSTWKDLALEDSDELYVAQRGEWIGQLMEHSEFKLAASEAFERTGGVSDAMLSMSNGGLDELASQVQVSACLDDVRWGASKLTNGIAMDRSNWARSVQTIRSFLEARQVGLAENESMGAFELEPGWHSVSIDESLSDAVEADYPYALAGDSASIRTTGTGTYSGELVAVYEWEGSEVSMPLAHDSQNLRWYFSMPDADVTIMAAGETAIGDVQASDAELPGTGEATPSVTVKDSSGNVLVRGRDYTLSVIGAGDLGRAYVRVDGLGVYAGSSAMGTFLVMEASRVSDAKWVRLGGEDRYATMQLISQAGFGDATGTTSEGDTTGTTSEGDTTNATVVLATGGNFPDAIVASSIAGIYDCPVLLTSSDELSSQARSEIVRLGAARVLVIGGDAAVSDDVLDELKAIQCVDQAERVYGADRMKTAVSVYKHELGSWGSTAIVACGSNFPDALSVAPYAYAANAPIFLTNDDGVLDQDAVQAILEGDFSKVIIIGGSTVVSDEVVSQLGSNVSCTRLGGADRYQTSILVALYGISHGLSVDGLAIATGQNYPDALAGGALCGHRGSVLLLATDSATGTAAIDSVVGRYASSIYSGYLLGGESVISESIEKLVVSLTGGVG